MNKECATCGRDSDKWSGYTYCPKCGKQSCFFCELEGLFGWRGVLRSAFFCPNCKTHLSKGDGTGFLEGKAFWGGKLATL